MVDAVVVVVVIVWKDVVGDTLCGALSVQPDKKVKTFWEGSTTFPPGCVNFFRQQKTTGPKL